MLNKASSKLKNNAKKHDIELRNQKEKKQKEEKQPPQPKQFRNPPVNIDMSRPSLSTDGGVSMRTLDLRCRYWIDQRLAQLLMNDNFTTRGAYSFAIRNGELTFEREGQTLATINSNGEFHGTNVFISGINVMAAIRELQRILNISGDLPDGYVRHYQLKNGTYELDVKSITAKDATLKHLLVQPDSGNSLEYKTDDGDYSLLLTTSDPGKGMGVLCPSMANNTTIYGFRFGKVLTTNNGAQFRFTYVSDANASNFLAMGNIGSADTLRVYGDRHVYIRTGNTLQQSLVCRYEGNLSNNQYIRLGCGDNRDTGILGYGRENNENLLYFKLQGRTAQMILYATRTQLDAGEYFQVNSTRTSGGLFYVIAQNIAAGSFAGIVVGQAKSNNNSATFAYYRQGGAITKPLGCLGFFGKDVITYDTDGYTTITTAQTNQNILNLHTSGTLTNTKYIRQLFSDSTGQAVIDLFHDSQYYGLRLKVSTDNTDDNELCIYPTGITMDGAVDIYDDLTVWHALYVDNICEATTDYGITLNNKTVVFADVPDESQVTDFRLSRELDVNSSVYFRFGDTDENVAIRLLRRANDYTARFQLRDSYYLGITTTGEIECEFNENVSFAHSGNDMFKIEVTGTPTTYQTTINTDVIINRDLTHSEYPLQLTQSTAMSANDSMKILIGDINNKTAVGYYIDANNNPGAYLKLFGKSAEVIVDANSTTITNTGNYNTLMITNTTYTGNLAVMKMHQTNLASGSFTCFDLGTPLPNTYARFKYYYHSTAANRFYSVLLDGVEVMKVFTDRVQIENNKKLTMNHDINGSCTSTDYSGNVNIDDTHVVTSKTLQAQISALQSQINNMQLTILQNIYRVGSLYINAYDGQNPANILGFGTWAQLPDNYFLMCVTGGGGGYGGNNTHNHGYGMRWGGWYNTLTGIGNDALSFYNNGAWTDVGGQTGTLSSYHPMFNALSVDTQSWYQAYVSTGSTTTLPAHFKVYVWCRTA